MGRFENGWYRLERRAVFEDIGQNPICLALWVWLLGAALIKESKIRWKNEAKVLHPGDIWFSIADLASRWDISKSTLHRHLQYLASTDRIKYESGTQGCIVTVLNWSKYQEDWSEDRTPAEHEENAPRTSAEQEANEARTEVEQEPKHIEQDTNNNKQPTRNKKPNGNGHDSPDGESPYSPTQQFIAAFCVGWKERYKTAPIIDGPNANAAKLITTGKNKIPLQRAIDLVQTYLLMNDRWFLTKRHDILTFKANLNAVAIKHDTGSSINTNQAQDMERADANVQAIREYRNSNGGAYGSQG